MTTPLAQYRTDVAHLRPNAKIWRILLGLGFAVIGQVIGTVVVFALYAVVVSATTSRGFGEALDRAGALDTPGSLIAVLLTFLGPILGVWLAMRWLHRSGTGVLMGHSGQLDIAGFNRAAAIFLVLGVAAFLVMLPFQGLERNLPMSRWLVWVIPALLVTFVQVFAEELLFRGYLQSQLAARFRSPLIFVGVPTLIFAAAHTSNAAAFGANAWIVLLAPMLIGLMAAHLTIRTGNLGPAVGLHFANNTLGLLLVAVPGPFGQLSLFLHPFDISDIATVRPFILGNLAFLGLAYIAFLALVPPRRAGLQRPADVFK